MKPTKDKVFFDSNVLIYSYSNSEPEKQAIARKLITENNSTISTQVLQELVNTVTKKFKFSYPGAAVLVKECCQNNNLHINTEDTVLLACDIAQQYHFSFFDSIIVSAALETGCNILYSEDMNHGQKIENCLIIINPFLYKNYSFTIFRTTRTPVLASVICPIYTPPGRSLILTCSLSELRTVAKTSLPSTS